MHWMVVHLLMATKLPTRVLTTAVLGLSVFSFSVLGSPICPAFAKDTKTAESASSQTQQGSSAQTTAQSKSYEISVADFARSNDDSDPAGSYVVQMTVPAFDQAKLYWNSTEDPQFSMRVNENPASTAEKSGAESTADPANSKNSDSTKSDDWSEWRNLMESGQTYLRNINGLFSLNLFSSAPKEVTIEIRSENFENLPEGDLSDLRLELSSEEKDLKSTISMIVVMLCAGGVLYIKKRHMIAK